MEALGGKDKQLAQLVDASNAVFADVRQGGRQPPEHAAPAAGRAAQDRHRRWASSPLPPSVLGPALHKLRPVRQLAGPGQRSHAQAGDQDDADHQERNPSLRPGNPADVNELAPATQALGGSVPQARGKLLGDQRILQRARLQPGPEQGRLRLLPGLGQPQPQQRREHSRRPRHDRAQPRLLQLQRPAASSKASPRSTKTVEPPRRPAQAADRGRMPVHFGLPTNTLRTAACKAPSGGLFSGLAQHPFSAAHVGTKASTGARGSARAKASHERERGERLDAEARPHARQHPRDHPVRRSAASGC